MEPKKSYRSTHMTTGKTYMLTHTTKRESDGDLVSFRKYMLGSVSELRQGFSRGTHPFLHVMN